MDAGCASPFDIRVSTKKESMEMDHGTMASPRFNGLSSAQNHCRAVGLWDWGLSFLCYPHKILLDYATISLAYNEHQIPIQLVL